MATYLGLRTLVPGPLGMDNGPIGALCGVTHLRTEKNAMSLLTVWLGAFTALFCSSPVPSYIHGPATFHLPEVLKALYHGDCELLFVS